MDAKRYEGKLKKWNPDRGFGFIVAVDGEQDIFVHISAFARDGRLPTVGEALTFEVEPDRNARRSAVRVRRLGESAPHFAKVAPIRMVRSRNVGNGSGLSQKLITVLVLVAVGLFAYSRYTHRVEQIEAVAPMTAQSPAPVSLFEPAQAAPVSFSCDGRRHCSQMTSFHVSSSGARIPWPTERSAAPAMRARKQARR